MASPVSLRRHVRSLFICLPIFVSVKSLRFSVGIGISLSWDILRKNSLNLQIATSCSVPANKFMQHAQNLNCMSLSNMQTDMRQKKVVCFYYCHDRSVLWLPWKKIQQTPACMSSSTQMMQDAASSPETMIKHFWLENLNPKTHQILIFTRQLECGTQTKKETYSSSKLRHPPIPVSRALKIIHIIH